LSRTKDRCKYQSVSLGIPLINEIKNYINEHDEYRSVADFVRQAVREKMDKAIELEKRVTKLEYELENLTKR